MKTETRASGIFASATFLLIGVGSFLSTSNPVHALVYGVISSLVMGFIGHHIGYIISHPKGKRITKHSNEFSEENQEDKESQVIEPLTGEETFLEDIGP